MIRLRFDVDAFPQAYGWAIRLERAKTMSALISTETNNKNITPHLASVSCLSHYQAIPLVCPDELTL
jgi:hypothetical protein